MKTNFTFNRLLLLLRVACMQILVYLAFSLLCLLGSSKISAQNGSGNIFKGPVIFINLMLPSADSLLLVDGTAAMYANKYSSAVNEDDAAKLSNFNENISLLRDGKSLAIEARGIPTKTDTLFIQMWSLKQKTYALQVTPQNVPDFLSGQGWLIDRYLHTQTLINLHKKTIYNFKSTADTNSYSNRFIIVFNRINARPNATITNLINNNEVINLNNNGMISLFPNPVKGSTINLRFENMKKGNYSVSLTTNTGKIITINNILHNGGNGTYTLNSAAKINSGIYTLLISDENYQKTIHLPLIIDK